MAFVFNWCESLLRGAQVHGHFSCCAEPKILTATMDRGGDSKSWCFNFLRRRERKGMFLPPFPHPTSPSVWTVVVVVVWAVLMPCICNGWWLYFHRLTKVLTLRLRRQERKDTPHPPSPSPHQAFKLTGGGKSLLPFPLLSVCDLFYILLTNYHLLRTCQPISR